MSTTVTGSPPRGQTASHRRGSGAPGRPRARRRATHRDPDLRFTAAGEMADPGADPSDWRVARCNGLRDLAAGDRPAGPILGCESNARAVRFGLERSYRALARLTPDDVHRVELVDMANAIRPRTLT